MIPLENQVMMNKLENIRCIDKHKDIHKTKEMASTVQDSAT